MKNKYFTGTLILLILLTCGILIKADSQTQTAPPLFYVTVKIDCPENEAHQSQIEGAIKRELRSLGDVQIVGANRRDGLWDFMVYVSLVEILGHRSSMNAYSYCVIPYQKVPVSHFHPDRQEDYKRFPAVYISTSTVGYVGFAQLDNFGKNTATDFDRESLQPIRDIIARKKQTKEKNR